MFYIDVPPVLYTNPWETSFRERFSSLQEGKPRIAYYYETQDNSTFRYRVYNMIQSLHKVKVSAAFFHQGEYALLPKIVRACDVFVVCRCRYSEHLNNAITLAKELGKRVFFDIDDMVYNPDYVHLILNTLDHDLKHPNDWDFWFAYVGRLRATLRLCDAVITTNSYLGKLIYEDTRKPVYVIPNYLNDEQLEISERIYADKEKRNFKRTDEIYLGYFSGSPTHNKDFDIITQPLACLFVENPKVRLRIVGYIELKESLQQHRSRIEFFPFHDFINLQRQIGLVEINLVPLLDNRFTNCKSELKYFEAAIVGTITVATPTYTYAQSIRDGENGFLANSFEWYEKIKQIIENLDKYRSWAENAKKDVLTRFDGRKMGDKIINILLG